MCHFCGCFQSDLFPVHSATYGLSKPCGHLIKKGKHIDKTNRILENKVKRVKNQHRNDI